MTVCSSCGADLGPDARSCATRGTAMATAPKDASAASARKSRVSRRVLLVWAVVAPAVAVAVLVAVVSGCVPLPAAP